MEYVAVDSEEPAFRVGNPEGASPFVIVCDHASNRIPDRYGNLGLSLAERLTHIAWDPGALSVSRRIANRLDAPLVSSTVSRLVIDTNRDLDAPDLIWTLSESTRIEANENLSDDERQFRIDNYHEPFHQALGELLDQRLMRDQETILVCVHSFTPVFHGVERPWPIGILHGLDDRFSDAVRQHIQYEDPNLLIGWNQPYAAMAGVTLTMERHGDGRGLTNTMIELRNNEILDEYGAQLWADRLVRGLSTARINLRD
ncbi:N-formylglutamate amidohydrolase [Devosia pacifica]|uniref:N-formylglutamate amidohydrolase n=1 Tax=Devosia pacifica TaxID=1335967 RepID=A0A918SAM0_9HYPH|nr:N-formylglutamate amidohydrolase [Devosia pacifica]GHA31590.1 N-formylglutamate amidohydrolase [Devosia pacifica]